jgi:sensor domain CHASE-containing protein
MSLRSRVDTWNGTVPRVAVPAAAALLVAALLIALLLYASTARSNSVALECQKRLVAQVLDLRIANLASEQESQTLKDTAVTLLEPMAFDERALGQLDRNWGVWFHRYYGHDETYLLSGQNQPFYAMQDGKRVRPDRFETLRAAAEPTIAQLRAKTRNIRPGTPLDASPGAADLVEINGHPAIVSVKPVISQNGMHTQPPRREMAHISVVRLDGRLVAELSQK